MLLIALFMISNVAWAFNINARYVLFP